MSDVQAVQMVKSELETEDANEIIIEEKQDDVQYDTVPGTSPKQHVHLQVPKIQELAEDGTSSTYTSDEEALYHTDAQNETTKGEGKNGEGGQDDIWTPPEEELVQKIIKQVEFYFSDANIIKDAFLLKHVRRNKEGYVSLKLITSFKKMKSLTKDWKSVRFSLEKSDKLVINKEGTKVKRINALPENDETTPSRTIVAVNLPMQEPSIEAVADLFSKCGDIALIRILRPGKSLPQDVKKHQNQHPELGKTVCALVEFEKSESARKAKELLSNKDDWRNGMHIAVLSKSTPKKTEKTPKEANKEVPSPSNGQKTGNEKSAKANAAQNGEDGDSENEGKSRRRRKKKNNRLEVLGKKGEGSGFSSSSDVEVSSPSPFKGDKKGTPSPIKHLHISPKSGQNHLSPGVSPKSSPHSSPRTSPRSQRRNKPGQSSFLSPKASPLTSPEVKRKTDYSSDGSGSSSPWVQRRLLAAQDQNVLRSEGNSPRSSPLVSRRMVDPAIKPCLADLEGVIRQPKGPDGSKGFSLGRGKPLVN
ncbi:la-related protein 6-like [Saccoglossus kowalevskii]|uniref:La-related protein 6-like n=1 Tax=Saccoglossus kowalevskii TaxID=10224 RepID=A0ABM0H0W6_SACKO|nr:PREDICTED: la-related protein 6-like [Saccoglossus kowalevskii]